MPHVVTDSIRWCVSAASNILGPHGEIAKLLGSDFESRPEQARMADAVTAAMAAKSHLLVEAGTGVGKSFAYLVPAILRAIHHKETLVVATNTISLQEQLVTKDIPLLMRAMGLQAPPSLSEEFESRSSTVLLQIDGRSADEVEPRPWDDVDDRASKGDPSGQPKPTLLKPVLVKGRGNYVSIRRLKLASSRQDRLFGDPAARRSLHAIEDWAYSTTDGTLSTLPTIERAGVWDKVQSDSANCMGRKCPTYDRCFYQRARAELEGANLLICNHALFFSDLALRSQDVGFLPRYDHVILDEAHGVEEAAADHFGASLTEPRVMHLLTTLFQARGNKGYLPQLSGIVADGAGASVERAMVLVEQCASATRAFFEQLLVLCRGGMSPFVADPIGPFTENSPGQPAPKGDGLSLRLRQPGMVTNVLTPAMRELSLRLKSLRESVKNEQDKFELNAYAIRAEGIAADAEALVTQSIEKCAYWVEIGGMDEGGRARDGRTPKVTFACAPIEVGPILKEHLFGKEHSVILTSATLATRSTSDEESHESAKTAFSHVMSRLGCEGAATLQLGSPFDYSKQVEFIIDRGVDAAGKPGTTRGNAGSSHGRNAHRAGGSYTEQLAARILHHVLATDGGAFVLFTSFSSLNAVASELAGTLAERGMPLLAQGRDGSRTLILERFKENHNSVLFGAASFWQGVDVRGQALRNVIITKLPFDPPDRPLTQARNELIESRGGSAFAEESLPRAIIRFKQGFGRLIRSATDHGRVVVLDSRLVTARYAARFLRALPSGLHARIEPPIEAIE